MPTAEVIVKEQADAQQPGGTQTFVMGQDESQRSDDMRRDSPENFALDQRFAHQTKFEMFEVA